jgi:hypothetical protein
MRKRLAVSTRSLSNRVIASGFMHAVNSSAAA